MPPSSFFPRASVDAVPVCVALLNAEGVIVDANAAWLALDPDAAPGGPLPRAAIGSDYPARCAAAHGTAAAQVAAGISAVLAGLQAEFSLEYACHAPEGQRWYWFRVSPLPSGGGVVVHDDITRFKLAELAARDSELRLQLALEAAGDGLWDWDLATGQTYLSPSYYAMTGYRAQEVTADPAFFQRLVHPDDWPGVLATMAAHLRGETPDSVIEYRMLTASGAARWIRGRGRVVAWDAAGKPQRMVGHISDVTGQKAVEAALRESEVRYRAVVEDQTEIIARCRVDGTVLFVNEVYCRLFGTTVAEAVGHSWQPVAHPDDLAMVQAQLAELSPGHPVVVVENRVFAAGGAVRWMQFVNRALFDATGNITEFQSVGRDITQRKELEARQTALSEEITRLGQELIRVQERERTCLAQELHDELSQQLVAVRAHAGAIRLRAKGTDGRTRSDARAIEAAASQIYDVSHRIMEGLHPQILDGPGLGEAVKSLLAEWSQQHCDTRARLRLAGSLEDLDEEMRSHLYRIVQSCLANVAAHARAGRVRLFLGLCQGRRSIRLVCRDDGVGMAMGGDKSSRGYGLILMRERVRALGGRFDLRSRPGQGVRVAVEIPMGNPA